MSAVIRVSVEGDKQLMAKLQRMGVTVSAVLETAVTAGAVIVEQAATGMAPGPHIKHDTVRKTQRLAEVDVGPDKEHWHYRFFETGAGAHQISGNPRLVFEGDAGIVVTSSVQHPGMAARPFLRPAIDEREDDAKAAMGKVWTTAIEEAR